MLLSSEDSSTKCQLGLWVWRIIPLPIMATPGMVMGPSTDLCLFLPPPVLKEISQGGKAGSGAKTARIINTNTLDVMVLVSINQPNAHNLRLS